MAEKSFSMIEEFESIESWRLRLWEAHARYQAAITRRRRLEGIGPEDQIRNLERRLASARRAESEALADYLRLIRIGIELRARRKAKALGAIWGEVRRLEDGDGGDSNFDS